MAELIFPVDVDGRELLVGRAVDVAGADPRLRPRAPGAGFQGRIVCVQDFTTAHGQPFAVVNIRRDDNEREMVVLWTPERRGVFRVTGR